LWPDSDGFLGDTIPHVIAAVFPSLRTSSVLSIFINRQVVIILCTAIVSYPLSLYRDITKLAKASALALVSMVIIVFTVVSEGPNTPEEYRGTTVALVPSGFGIFQAIGVISFAFVCHHNSLLIYGALKKPTIDRFARVTHFSTGLSLVACLIMAVAGVLVFKDKTMGNILNNFPSENGLVNLARFCFGFNCFTTLPLELFVYSPRNPPISLHPCWPDLLG
jgi:solute carrier family 38 (sodium-coupled neutral amino acid transporter), member 11